MCAPCPLVRHIYVCNVYVCVCVQFFHWVRGDVVCMCVRNTCVRI